MRKKAIELLNAALSHIGRNHELIVKDLILRAIRELNKPVDFVTPGQYERSVGKKYPDKAPVWYAEADLVWKLRSYKEALQDWMRRDMDSLYTYMVCAIGDRMPKDGYEPGPYSGQWFDEN
jgi:hypothetical protein